MAVSNRPGLPLLVSRAAWILVAGVLLQSRWLDCGETGFTGAAQEETSGEGEGPRANEPEGGTAENPGGEGVPERASLTDLTGRLGREYPDRDAVLRGGDAVPRALLEFAEKHADDITLAADVGRARQLAAEALLVQGRRAEALRVYSDLVSAGPLDTHRALALFVLGELQFLRERYVSKGRRLAADYYWGLLTRRFPQSDWAGRAERPMRYIDFLSGFPKGGRKAPAFVGTFEQAAAPGLALEKRSYSTEGLRGKVVLLEFWTAAVPGRGERVKTLAAGLASNLEEYPDLEGKIQALGVNLDTSRELFDSAIAAWGTPWPELHDGQGFRTPLAEAFAIPRVPQWVVIEASGGRVVHIGADYDRFLAAASRELRRARGLAE